MRLSRGFQYCGEIRQTCRLSSLVSFCQKRSCATLVHTSGGNSYGFQGLASTTGRQSQLIELSLCVLTLLALSPCLHLPRFFPPISTFHNLRWPCPYQITTDPLAPCSKWSIELARWRAEGSQPLRMSVLTQCTYAAVCRFFFLK